MSNYTQEDLEKLFIGSIIAWPEGLATVVVDMRDLTTAQAIASVGAAQELIREHKPVNLQTLVMATDVKYATWMAEASDSGIGANLVRLLAELQERGRQRRILAGTKNIERTNASRGSEAAMEEMRELYNSEAIQSEESGTIHEALREFDEQSEKYREQGNIGISTGFEKWDMELITYEPGHLIAVGGFTSVGKTATALEFAGRIGPNNGLAVFSLEMTKPQIISRMLSRLTGFSSRMILSGRIEGEAQHQLKRAKEHLAGQKIFIFRKLRDWAKIETTCRNLRMRGELDIAVWDYFQNIKIDGGTKFEKAENLAHRAQDLCQDLEITGVMLSQISQNQNRDDSGSAEYKGGGGLAEVADIGLHLSREKKQGGKVSDELLVEMRKNRHGPRVDLLLKFQDNYTRLSEIA